MTYPRCLVSAVTCVATAHSTPMFGRGSGANALRRADVTSHRVDSNANCIRLIHGMIEPCSIWACHACRPVTQTATPTHCSRAVVSSHASSSGNCRPSRDDGMSAAQPAVQRGAAAPRMRRRRRGPLRSGAVSHPRALPRVLLLRKVQTRVGPPVVPAPARRTAWRGARTACIAWMQDRPCCDGPWAAAGATPLGAATGTAARQIAAVHGSEPQSRHSHIVTGL